MRKDFVELESLLNRKIFEHKWMEEKIGTANLFPILIAEKI
jgi:hypothetical protein